MNESSLLQAMRATPAVESESIASVQAALVGILGIVQQRVAGPVQGEEFERMRDTFRQWGFDNIVEGTTNETANLIATRFQNAEGQCIHCAPNGFSGDHVIEQLGSLGLTDRVQFFLADCPDHRRYTTPAFAVGLKADTGNRWLACGSGLGVQDQSVFDLVWVLRCPDQRTKSNALGTIHGLSPEQKDILVAEVMKVVEKGQLAQQWDSMTAGGYGVALALSAHQCVDAVVAYGQKQIGADTHTWVSRGRLYSDDSVSDRHVWVNRVLGDIKRRNAQAVIPEPQATQAVGFLIEGVRSNPPSTQVAWSAAESLGEMGAIARDALPVLRDAVKAGLDSRVAQIYRTAIDKIRAA